MVIVDCVWLRIQDNLRIVRSSSEVLSIDKTPEWEIGKWKLRSLCEVLVYTLQCASTLVLLKSVVNSSSSLLFSVPHSLFIHKNIENIRERNSFQSLAKALFTVNKWWRVENPTREKNYWWNRNSTVEI